MWVQVKRHNGFFTQVSRQWSINLPLWLLSIWCFHFCKKVSSRTTMLISLCYLQISKFHNINCCPHLLDSVYFMPFWGSQTAWMENHDDDGVGTRTAPLSGEKTFQISGSRAIWFDPSDWCRGFVKEASSSHKYLDTLYMFRFHVSEIQALEERGVKRVTQK